MAKGSGTTKYVGSSKNNGTYKHVPPAPSQALETNGGNLKIYNIPSSEIQNLSSGAKAIMQAVVQTERNTLNDAIMRAQASVNQAIAKGTTRSIVRQQNVVKELQELRDKYTIK